MKNIKIYGLIAALVTVLIIVFVFNTDHERGLKQSIKIGSIQTQLHTLNKNIGQMGERADAISKLNRVIKDATNKKDKRQNELEQKMNEFQRMSETLQHEIDQLQNSINKGKNSGLSMQTFWVKVAFSGIFCLAALFVVLSNKYDETTKKWALNVLVGIAGVWIGTIS